MNRILLVTLCCFLVASVSRGGDTNFVAVLNMQWQGRNASNILVFVENQVSTNRNVETLFARGIVAAAIQEWGRGATNYLGQALHETSTNALYSALGKAHVIKLIVEVKGLLEAIAEDTGEPLNSRPSWNTNNHDVIFSELGDEAPFFNVLREISVTK